ncbi:transcription factor FER-LIKE IRON DEFICIENCY-INDUCED TRANSCRIPTION FACTOR [Argentina anserina]|uniref:transcription factor FER-LIKE IRON DEFICIENCY-INDUCED TRANSCRIPTION FACTOR n=1 Tax=Argentina anserina TaxID=57926 RepID=UPI0021767E4A|nr:transcription factor FER-LIKE IRON DEFICIENCY-INDUCED TRANSCRIPTION FACTOR [Potentilla anserina]
MEGMGAFGNYDLGGHNIINDFELQDFIVDANFDQFIDLIRGENEDPAAQFDLDLITGSCLDNQLAPTSNPVGLFGFHDDTTMLSDPTPFLTTLPSFGGEMNHFVEEDNDGNDSSGTTTTTTTTATTNKKAKVDRSRTLVSERKRRGRMKDKLYALRSLVPNITKMDKASIIGDAVLYVQDLQKQANNLKGEILQLEASFAGSEENVGSTKKKVVEDNHLVPKGIIQVDVYQVEEKGFYVKVGCNRGVGVATALYKAIESLTSFNVRNSNLNMVDSTKFEITLTLNVKECEQEIMNLPNLKLWVTGAFLNQGFELATCF